MPIAAGTEVYAADHPPVIARGLSFNDTELEGMLADVRAVLRDEAGALEVETLLAGVAATEFAQATLQQVLRPDRELEHWRIGEAIAESYLVEHRNCEFPWPGGRDLKNPESSPAGTDLVGFQPEGSSARFSFAEVKTSTDITYPPALMYGRHGLKQQLDGLRDSTAVKDGLVKYLGLHATGRPWNATYRQAASRYIHDRSDIIIFGVLVRDVDPSHLDCAGRANKLSQQCPALTAIELIGLYLPAGTIPMLPQRISIFEEGQ